MRFFLTYVIFLAASENVFAGASMEFLTHNLTLSETQIPVVKKILKQEHSQHKQLRQNGKPSCETMKTLRSNTRNQLKGVLSKVQLDKYDEMLSRRNRSCKVSARYGGGSLAVVD